MNILDDIPVELQLEELLQAVQMGGRGVGLETTVEGIVERVTELAKPKALYRVSFLGNREETSVEIDGVVFTSRVLVKNLKNVERVFPYVVTAGRELEGIETPKGDMMENFLLDAARELVLEHAFRFFEEYLRKQYALDMISTMHPGSLKDWPIGEQLYLFELLGDVENSIGVKLKPSFLMDPVKTVSGIYFTTEVSFVSCMLCPRKSCPKRQAEYNAAKAKEYKP